MRPGDQGLAALLFGETFEGRRLVCEEAVQGAVCLGAGEERTYGVVDKVRGVDGDEVLVCQFAQGSDLC